ncbi:stage II sporulation protein M [Paenibacillus sp. P96]|uniref:Stage II sporulation protein M n=1 Tax=Paenibacillus zeirhizosphaerae TaxID=2987519 RepID=A0ABT9FMD5_9BACL|nr:stage II sporulation protein M [Paenibacillus sp. P96]MDP4095911.1 stage II sporulation protein M [Paenibacillus sp. P96]
MGFQTFLKILNSMKGVLLFATVLFCASIGLGWVSTGIIEQLLRQQIEGLGQVAGRLGESGNVQLNFFVFIFLNNVIKCVLVMFLGAAFGIIPMIFIIMNGMVIGFLVHWVANSGTVNLYELIVKGLLPHGVIELPVLLIACAYGLKFGGMVTSSIRRGITGDNSRRKPEMFWPAFMKQTWNVTLWVVILLFIAAIIESTVSYSLMRG